MKVKVLSLTLGGLFVASPLFADVNAQIAQLQQQINQLQNQLSQNQTVSNGSMLGQIDAGVARDVFTDYTAPFGTLPDTGLAYALLQQQDKFTSPLTLGGQLEADIQAYGGSSNLNGLRSASSSGTDIAATTAKIFVLGNINSWTQAFVTVKGGLNGASTNFSEAFLNFGNLSKNPLYATIGKTYLPVGVFYGNGPWANNLLTNAFRPTEINQVDFGFGKGGLNTNLALFNGENNMNDFAYSLQYGENVNNFSLSGGAGYLNDVRYTGIGVGSAYATNGNAPTASSPLTGGRNSAADVNASVGYSLGNNQSLKLGTEWMTTTSSAMYNNVATGKMQAWNVTGAYVTPILSRNTMFSLGYSATINMQNVPLLLPAGPANTTGETIIGAKNQWLAFVNTEVLNNVYAGPELARMKLYNGQYSWESTFDVTAYF